MENAVVTPPPLPKDWSPLQKVALRFAALYSLFGYLAGTSSGAIFFALGEEVGRRVWPILGPIATEETGSGDRLADWLASFGVLLIAAAGTALWSLIDRKRPGYRWIYEALRVFLRYTAAMGLIGYGFAKTSQFPAVSYIAMARPLGSETAMGMLWNFMGTSTPYTLFSGVLEIAAGVLLLFRRTTTLGALLAMVVMANVFVLNLFYDVPVKLYSLQLLVTALVLLLPDVRRLVNVLLLNLPTQPREITPSPRYPKLRIGVLAVKWLFFGNLLWGGAQSSWAMWQSLQTPTTPYDGIWNVTSFRESGKELETVSLKDPVRWQRFVVNRTRFGKHCSVEYVGGKTAFGSVRIEGEQLRISSKGKSQVWNSRPMGENGLLLSGFLRNKPIQITLQRAHREEFPLAYRSFHLIQERPRTP